MQPDDSIEYRFKAVEQDLEVLRRHLSEYVRVREHDLQLTSISDTAIRVEREVQNIKQEMQVMNTRLAAQDKQQDKIQISVLKWAVSIFVGIAVSIVTAVLLYFILRPGG